MLRPQTWYLIAAAVCTVACLLFGAGTTAQLLLLIGAALAALAVIPLYKNRPLQASLCLLPMALLLAWYVLLAVNATPDTLSWHHALPVAALACLFMARKGIVHDEKVVRSLDRIR